MTVVGIDVSKTWFDCAWPIDGRTHHREEPSDVAIQKRLDKTTSYGLLRYARKDDIQVFRCSL